MILYNSALPFVKRDWDTGKKNAVNKGIFPFCGLTKKRYVPYTKNNHKGWIADFCN